jgi:hypothetical protein
MRSPGLDLHPHADVGRLEHLAGPLGVLGDFVVLARHQVHAPDLRVVLVEELRSVAEPVPVVRRQNQPAAEVDRVAHADLLRDEGAFAEADENVSARAQASRVLVAQGRERGVDDALRRVGVVVPGAAAGVGRARALRADDPAEDSRHPRPLAAVFEGVAAPTVQVKNDLAAGFAPRFYVVCVRKAGDLEDHRIRRTRRLVGSSGPRKQPRDNRKESSGGETGTAGHGELGVG